MNEKIVLGDLWNVKKNDLGCDVDLESGVTSRKGIKTMPNHPTI